MTSLTTSSDRHKVRVKRRSVYSILNIARAHVIGINFIMRCFFMMA